MSEFYYPDLSRGVRWNDPAFQFDWPAPPMVMSDRDRAYSDFE
jgi:dTDP-4-dehydrorhamnose 3,5-epimerase